MLAVDTFQRADSGASFFMPVVDLIIFYPRVAWIRVFFKKQNPNLQNLNQEHSLFAHTSLADKDGRVNYSEGVPSLLS